MKREAKKRKEETKESMEGETKFPNSGSFIYRFGFPLAQDGISIRD